MADKSKQQSPSDDKTIDISKDKPGKNKTFGNEPAVKEPVRPSEPDEYEVYEQ